MLTLKKYIKKLKITSGLFLKMKTGTDQEKKYICMRI